MASSPDLNISPEEAFDYIVYDFPTLAKDIVIQGSFSYSDLKSTINRVGNNLITDNRVASYYKAFKDEDICLMLNHLGGKGCKYLPTCPKKHICMMCKGSDHGAFQTNENEEYLCPHQQAFSKEWTEFESRFKAHKDANNFYLKPIFYLRSNQGKIKGFNEKLCTRKKRISAGDARTRAQNLAPKQLEMAMGSDGLPRQGWIGETRRAPAETTALEQRRISVEKNSMENAQTGNVVRPAVVTVTTNEPRILNDNSNCLTVQINPSRYLYGDFYGRDNVLGESMISQVRELTLIDETGGSDGPIRASVAVKMWLLRGRDEDRKMISKQLMNEIQSLRKLSSDYVVKNFDSCADIEIDRFHYALLIMEKCEKSLGQYIKEQNGGLLPWDQIRSFATQILEAVEHCHKNCVRHRDIKPANILTCFEKDVNGYPKLKFCDFAVSRHFSSGFGTISSTVIGTGKDEHGYWMAPEIPYRGLLESSCAEADVWSTGCVLFFIATSGKPLFSNENQAKTGKYEEEAKMELIAREPLLWDLISKMTKLNASERIAIYPKTNENDCLKPRRHPAFWSGGDIVVKIESIQMTLKVGNTKDADETLATQREKSHIIRAKFNEFFKERNWWAEINTAPNSDHLRSILEKVKQYNKEGDGKKQKGNTKPTQAETSNNGKEGAFTNMSKLTDWAELVRLLRNISRHHYPSFLRGKASMQSFEENFGEEVRRAYPSLLLGIFSCSDLI